MSEIWKDVIGYEGLYRVSNAGNIKRIANGRGRCVAGSILRPIVDSRGYLVVNLHKMGRQRQMQIHTLVLEAFVGPRPQNLEACHNDGNKINPKLNNLRWDTHSANQLDAVAHGTHVDNRGSRQGSSRLMESDVLQIWCLLSNGSMTQKEIGQIFGVRDSTISRIKTRKRWGHV